MQQQPSLDELLEDVLKDFNVPPSISKHPAPLEPRQPAVLGASAPLQDTASLQPSTPASLSQGHDCPRWAAGPSGLGQGLPTRPVRSKVPESSKAQHSEPAKASNTAGLAFDPLRKGASGPHPARRQKLQQHQLPPDVQQLADNLLNLVHESNIGSAGSDQSATSSTSTTNAGLGQDSECSSTIHGLMEHTKRTVAAQSKFSRGERGPEGSSQLASANQQLGSAGGLLSALGGDLGGLSGLLGAAGGESASDDGGLGSGMVDMIMRQLLSKDVLYTPLKEIGDKYPLWLESTLLPAEEVRRYKDQYKAIQAVVRQYDEDPNDFAKLTDLIQEMQKYGDPPAAIVEEVGGSMNQPGLFASDGSGGEGGGKGQGFNPEDLENVELPPDILKDLPQELLKDLPPEMQKDCCIM